RAPDDGDVLGINQASLPGDLDCYTRTARKDAQLLHVQGGHRGRDLRGGLAELLTQRTKIRLGFERNERIGRGDELETLHIEFRSKQRAERLGAFRIGGHDALYERERLPHVDVRALTRGSSEAGEDTNVRHGGLERRVVEAGSL